MFNDITLIIFALSAMFCLQVIASCYALGRFHTWLKERGEVFGDSEGLRDELADIRGRLN